MLINKSKVISDVVRQNYHTARIFEHYGIDYAFSGYRTIEEACKEKCLNPYEIAAEISQFIEKYNSSPKMFDILELDNLIDYIINNHHSFTRTNLPHILQRVDKELGSNGDEKPVLNKARQNIEKLMKLLDVNYIREERTLFPLIKTLVETKRTKAKLPPKTMGKFDSVCIPIDVVLKEHRSLSQVLNSLRRVTGNYTLKEGSDAAYEEIYNDLNEFEKDIHMHVHLENNILFPKAAGLEKELRELK
jgi:regulator of cell morphogenesis and NO signaling